MNTTSAVADAANPGYPTARDDLRAAAPYLTLLVLVQISLALILVLSAA